LLNKYSNSRRPLLTVRPSRTRLLVLLLFALATQFAIFLVYQKAYPVTAATLLLGSLVLLFRAWPDPIVGVVLKWEKGEWFLSYQGGQTSVVLLPGSVRLPWLIFMVFQEAHASRRWNILLFSDSADSDQLRRLRRRLILE